MEEEREQPKQALNQQKYNSFDIEEANPAQLDRPSDFEDDDIRSGFIRKVYGILALQLAVTAGFTSLPFLSENFRQWQLAHPGLAITFSVLTFVVCIMLICCRGMARKVPTNYALLTTFTLAEGYIVSFVAS